MNAAAKKPARRSFATFLKDAVLFLAAPFISLVYMAMFPFIGIYLLAKARSEARAKQKP